MNYVIDPISEEIFPFQDARKHVPGNPHLSTLHRWRLRGIRGYRLATVLIGGRRFTSANAIATFLAAINGADLTPLPNRTMRRRHQAVAAADRQLDQAGI